MTRDGISERPELLVDRVSADDRPLWTCRECRGIDEQIDVFRDAIEQLPAFRQTGPALQHGLGRVDLRDDAQDLGEVVVLLDPRLRDPPLRRDERDELAKIGVLVQLQRACHSRA